ncbi:hypothetical protein D5F01_LYC24459 [Larimichthys crocea]|uniref:DUF4371 domain-containing protein n=1 Tax=Larimichthys crocea TaxID=215358 RepID=A0A6G0HEA5_LARCR|nr:hypothetical protein D5F01_LYC24459 [Larimichthys crocea]
MHAGKYEKEYPAKTPLRATRLKELKARLSEQQAQFTRPNEQSKAATIASYRASHILAKHKKPFKDGEAWKEGFLEAADSLFDGFKNKTEIMKAIKMYKCPAIPLQSDVRMVFEDMSAREELLTMLPLKGQTRGEDIFNAFMTFARKTKLPLFKLISITTDGAPAMIGRTNGFIALCKQNEELDCVDEGEDEVEDKGKTGRVFPEPVKKKNEMHKICKHHKSSPLSVRKGSIFARSHTPLAKWLEFILRFAQGLQLRQLDLITDGIAASSKTLTSMTKILRKACVAGLKRLRKTGMKIGGRHRFVVVDESKFAHKRKYHRGRCGNTWRRDCQWVFGMLEVDGTSRRPILRLVKDCSRKTLIGRIVRHYSAAELLRLRGYLAVPPPVNLLRLHPDIALLPRRRYTHRGSRRSFHSNDASAITSIWSTTRRPPDLQSELTIPMH